MELHRRNFLIGMGATIAALQLPPVAIGETLNVVRSLADFDYRAIEDITIGFQQLARFTPDNRLDTADRRVTVDVMRGENVILHFPMNVKSTFRWWAPPGQELIYLKNSVLHFSVTPPEPGTECVITYNTKRPPLRKVYVEGFAWDGDKLTSQWIQEAGLGETDPVHEMTGLEHYEDDWEGDETWSWVKPNRSTNWRKLWQGIFWPR